MSGRLIVVEGLDGVGKTTLSRALASVLDAEWTSTPGSAFDPVRPTIDAVLRDHPEALQLFYASTLLAASDRARRWLAEGRSVVVDRYWCSTVAYAGLQGRSLDLGAIAERLVPADATLFVDLAEEERVRRLRARGMTDADAASLQPLAAATLRAHFVRALKEPLAGNVRPLLLDGLSTEAAVHAARMALRDAVAAPSLWSH